MILFSGDIIECRGANDEYFYDSWDTSVDYYKFIMTGKIAASGNIMSLVDFVGSYNTDIPYVYCFKNLFLNCTGLTSAPELPATTLDHSCYSVMLYDCDSIERLYTTSEETADELLSGGDLNSISNISYPVYLNGSYVGMSNNDEVCLVRDTLITLSDYTVNPILDITYSDQILTYNIKEDKYEPLVPLIIMKGFKTYNYAKITFDDNSIIKLNAPVGLLHCHRLYICETNLFGQPDLNIGKSVQTLDGSKIIKNVEIINEPTILYNIITKNNLNYFANGILSASGFDNSISSVIQHTKDEFLNISYELFDGLSIAYSTESVESINKYINKLLKNKQN